MPTVYPGIFIDHPHVWYQLHGHKYHTTEERDSAYSLFARMERCTALIELLEDMVAAHQIQMRVIESELERAQAGCFHGDTKEGDTCDVCGKLTPATMEAT